MTKHLQGATEFESALVEHILDKDAPEYKQHLQFISVCKRETTGVGLYVYFEYSDKFIKNNNENKTIGKTVYIDIEGLEGGAGSMLYIDEGCISMLEIFSHYSENWPSKISKFEIKNL